MSYAIIKIFRIHAQTIFLSTLRITFKLLKILPALVPEKLESLYN